MSAAISQRLAQLLDSERVMYAEIEGLETQLHAKRRQYGRLQCSIDELVRSESSASPVGGGDRLPAAPSLVGAAGGVIDSPLPRALAGVLGRPVCITAHTEQGKELLRRLPHGDSL